MRTRLITDAAGLAFALVLVSGCGDDAQPSSGELRMLSYNVAGLPEFLSSSEPSVNMPLISERLDAYDLVVVQEDWLASDSDPLAASIEVYHDVLAADASHPHQSVPAPLPLGTNPDRPEALLSDGLNRFSMFPFGELTRVPWEGCFGSADTSDGGSGDCLAMKGFSVASHTLARGVEVHVYNLHGEAGGTDLDQALQWEGFAMMTDFIERFSEGYAVILGGDTNLHTHDDDPDGHGDEDLRIWNDLLATTGLVDVCEVITPCERGIDKVAFRSAGGVALEPLSHRYARDDFLRDDGEPLSDHPPVVVRFAWSRDDE